MEIQTENGHGENQAFNNDYWDKFEDGVYLSASSGVPLFSSKEKFDSGMGWPSFTHLLQKGVIHE